MEKEGNKPEDYKIDPNLIAKSYATGLGAHWLAKIAIALAVIIFWAICYLLLFQTGWVFKMSANIRGVLIIAIIALPLFIAVIFHQKLKDYLLKI